VRKLTFGVCACFLLASCATDVGTTDPVATKTAENQYSVCLADAAARLDDGRSEAAAIGNSVAGTCYPQFLQVQAADGDAAREEYLRVHAPPNAVSMYQQDLAEQTRLATQAVLVHRQRIYDREGNDNGGSAYSTSSTSSASGAVN
jgi:hypothetical protein